MSERIVSKHWTRAGADASVVMHTVSASRKARRGSSGWGKLKYKIVKRGWIRRWKVIET